MAEQILKYIDGIPLYADAEDAELFKHLNIDALGKTTLPTTSTPFPTMPKGLNYDSPLGDRSVFAEDIVNIEKIEKKREEFEKLNFEFEKLDFAAGENAQGNPEKNGFGHGDIEKIALANIYSEQEIKEVYYGNWLRDFSQFLVGITVRPDIKTQTEIIRKYGLNSQEKKMLEYFLNVFTQENWITLLEIFATKEFIWNDYNKKNQYPYSNGNDYIKEFKQKFPPLTINTLGIYRPEEHIDNPKGQKDESKFSYINFNYEYEKNKFKEKYLLYKGETLQSLFINAGSNQLIESYYDAKRNFIYYPQGLKYYIFKDIDQDRPSSITYFFQQLRLSVAYGNTNVGRMHLGAALHVLEDYFAHTNFVEVSLVKLVDEEIYPWVNRVDETNAIVDKKQTKEFWKDKKHWVIKEAVVGVINERANCIPIVTGIFLTDDTLASVAPKIADNFFGLSYEPYKPRKVGERSLFDIGIITVLSAFAKKQSEEPNIKKEFDAKYWLSIYKQYLGVLDAIAKFEEDYPILGFVTKSIKKISSYVSFVTSYFLNLIFNLIFGNTGKAIKQAQSLNYGSNPTHTQIAKDPFDHPLNPLAGILAIEAVKDVTLQVKKSIIRGKIDNVTEKYILEKYFAHPCKTSWMDKIVLEWAKQNKPKLQSLHYPTITAEAESKLKPKQVDSNSFLKQFKKLLSLFSLLFLWIFSYAQAPKIDTPNYYKQIDGQLVFVYGNPPVVDTVNYFDKFQDKKAGISFLYPKKWKKHKPLKNWFDLALYDSTNKICYDENSEFTIIYGSFNLLPNIETIDERVVKSVTNKYGIFTDSFTFIDYKKGVNKNGISYYLIKTSGVINSCYAIVYELTYFNKKNLSDIYSIQILINPKTPKKYDKLFELICDSFSYADKLQSKINKEFRNKKYK